MDEPARYAEWQPAPVLRRHLLCSWVGRFAQDGAPYTDRVLPDACMDLIWDGQRLFVAGPDTGPVPLSPVRGAFFAGVRFRPGRAPTFLPMPSSELLDLRVDAADVVGDRATGLTDRLVAAPSLRDAATVLEDALVGWLPSASEPDPLVEETVRVLSQTRDTRPVAALASRLGISERQLHRRCKASVGYGPKMLHRVLRFRRFLSWIDRWPHRNLAGLAAAAGFADQAHLTRDAQQLAGVAPGALVYARRPPPR